MASIKINISIPTHQANFLDENPILSPSEIFQSAVENIMASQRNNPQLIEARKEINNLQKIREKLQNYLQDATEFITTEGLWNKFQEVQK